MEQPGGICHSAKCFSMDYIFIRFVAVCRTINRNFLSGFKMLGSLKGLFSEFTIFFQTYGPFFFFN